jgi:hypothetical protein
MKRLLILIFLLSILSGQAQKLTFWQKVNRVMTTYNNVDTLYVYQPKQGFTLGTFATEQQAGVNVNILFDLNSSANNALSGLSHYTLKGGISTRLGLELGYGKLVFDYGLEIGPKNAYKKRTLALNILGKAWGVNFNFFKITNPYHAIVSVGEEGAPDYWQDEVVASEPSVLRSLTIDGYYVFNNKRFAYPAVYKAGLVQRRTAGSWMVAARYMQGELSNSPKSAYDAYNLLDGFSTMQVAIGGGYSANIVCWHRDPVELRDKGLRNLTINLTAMPVISVFNYLRTSSFKYNDVGECIGKTVSKIYCYPMPSYIGSAAVGMTLNRFFLSAQFTYNLYYFYNPRAVNAEQLQISGFEGSSKFYGSFHDWKVKVMFTYKF